MKAQDLTKDHLGWYVEVNHVKGVLKIAVTEGDYVRVMAIDPKTKIITGDMIPLDAEVHIEKTLEDQVKEDMNQLKNSALNWLRKKIK